MPDTFSFSPINHGSYGNPHSQYDPVSTYSSEYESEGNAFIKVFELSFASLDDKIKGTLQRFYFGFKLVDDASDDFTSIVEFNGYIGIDYQKNLIVKGTKKPLHQTYNQNTYYALKLHVLSTKVNDSFQVEAYIQAPWRYKRLTIIQPWVNTSKERFITTPTTVMGAKVPNFEKTINMFSSFRTAGFTNVLPTAQSDYVFPEGEPKTYSNTTTLTETGIQLVSARVGNMVTIAIHGTSEHTVESTTIGYIPLGYRPAITSMGIGYKYSNPTTNIPITITSDGKIVITGSLAPKDIYYATATYVTTDSIPV